MQLLRNGFQLFLGGKFLTVVTQPLAFLFQHVAAALDILFLAFLFEPGFDLVAGIGRTGNVDPVTAGAGSLFAGDDLHDIAVGQLVIQRHDAPVHLGADTAVAYIRMDPVRKVDGHGTHRQVDDIATGREHKDLVRKDVHLYRIHEVPGIVHVIMPFQQLTQPGQLFRIGLVRTGSHIGTAAFLVTPMCCDTVFTDPVHLESTDLDFQRLPVGKGYRGMQGLVHIGFGHGHIILETSRDRAPEAVNHAQCPVTVFDGIYQDADSKQVINLIQFFMIPHHLFVNAVEILGASLDLTPDVDLVQFPAHGFHSVVDHGLPFFPFCPDLFYQIVIQFGIPVTERHVFQFPFNRINTQPVGQRRVNFQRFLGNRLLLVHRHILHGPHVVQAVRQFDDNDTDVLGHGQKHLAVILDLPLFFGNIFNFAQLGHAVYQHGNLRAEHFLQLLKGSIRILYHIVEKSCRQRFFIHFHLGQDISYLCRVNDIRLAGTPLLICMHLRGKFIRLLHKSKLFFIKICL